MSEKQISPSLHQATNLQLNGIFSKWSVVNRKKKTIKRNQFPESVPAFTILHSNLAFVSQHIFKTILKYTWAMNSHYLWDERPLIVSIYILYVTFYILWETLGRIIFYSMRKKNKKNASWISEVGKKNLWI